LGEKIEERNGERKTPAIGDRAEGNGYRVRAERNNLDFRKPPLVGLHRDINRSREDEDLCYERALLRKSGTGKSETGGGKAGAGKVGG
jgi:hypothetical protein